jgi:hypothetical protein
VRSRVPATLATVGRQRTGRRCPNPLRTPAREVIARHPNDGGNQCRRCGTAWPCFDFNTALGAIDLVLRVHVADRCDRQGGLPPLSGCRSPIRHQEGRGPAGPATTWVVSPGIIDALNTVASYAGGWAAGPFGTTVRCWAASSRRLTRSSMGMETCRLAEGVDNVVEPQGQLRGDLLM